MVPMQRPLSIPEKSRYVCQAATQHRQDRLLNDSISNCEVVDMQKDEGTSLLAEISYSKMLEVEITK